MEQTYMKEKPILPLLLSMALPMVLSMMVNSLYNIIDSYFVAKINENAMTALSLVFPVQNLITAVGVGFGIGINATIAYFLGAQKQEKADTSATLGVACSFLHGVLLTIGTIGHYANVSFHVYKRSGSALHGNYLLPDHIWFLHYYFSGNCL